MASMEDLIATLSGGLHAGQQGNDLKDLHSKLAQTLNTNMPHPHYRPIPPQAGSSAIPSAPIPPAPASSWNTPPPNNGYLYSSSPTLKSHSKNYNQSTPPANASGLSREGFTVPMPNSRPNYQSQQQQQQSPHQQQQGEDRSYHVAGSPIRPSPKDMGGFTDDAFKPLWQGENKGQWNGFTQKGA